MSGHEYLVTDQMFRIDTTPHTNVYHTWQWEEGSGWDAEQLPGAPWQRTRASSGLSCGKSVKPHIFELTGFSYLLERSLSSSSIWSIFLSKSGTWYSQHGLDLDFDHLKNNWWSPLTRSHTCCKASRCTGPKGPWVDIWWWLFSPPPPYHTRWVIITISS